MKKVLLITGSFGNGHLQVSKNIKEAFEKYYIYIAFHILEIFTGICIMQEKIIVISLLIDILVLSI